MIATAQWIGAAANVFKILADGRGKAAEQCLNRRIRTS
jgi:hypothetical protein